MIPVRLILKNFLSYRDATLDFTGLHTACICGPNGAGKSSLLESITWAIWGQSRANIEDDVIYAGSQEVRVDFTFYNNLQKYRVIRTRTRGATGILEFQLETPAGFRPLTGKGIRATQDLILQHIKLDYETFINSAYLRQGRADEFMLKGPAQRKEILAELLKLNQYDLLEERAKDNSKQCKGRVEELERSIHHIQLQLTDRETIQTQRAALETRLHHLQQQQTSDYQQLQDLQVVERQRHDWETKLGVVQQQCQNLVPECDRLYQDSSIVKSQLEELDSILGQSEEIQAGYLGFQALQSQEESFTRKFEQHNLAISCKQSREQELMTRVQAIQLQIQQESVELKASEKQEQELQGCLHKSGEVETALSSLSAAREHLNQMDQLQVQVTPLLQQRASLQSQIDRVYATLSAKLEGLENTRQQLQSKDSHFSRLQESAAQLDKQIEELEKKRVYLQRVHEKGNDRRHVIERLQTHQIEYEKSLGKLEQKIQLLQEPNALCPLCERPLDEHNWSRVVEKTQGEYKDTQEQFWQTRELLAVSDQEIQALRAEYQAISRQVAEYESLRQKKGELGAQLQAMMDDRERLKQLTAEKESLQAKLQGNYAPELQQELQEVDQHLQQLNYQEESHALARSEIERWRWAEIKQAQIKDAQKKMAQLAQIRPKLVAKIEELQAQVLWEQTNSPIAQEIRGLAVDIAAIGYSHEAHQEIHKKVQGSQHWQLKHQQLLSAQQQYPYLEKRLADLSSDLQQREALKQKVTMEIGEIEKQLASMVNPREKIADLDQNMVFRRREMDETITHLGRLEQKLHQLEMLQNQYEQEKEQLAICKKQQRVYQELAQAFGKNGIQALMIENVLPQLEAETNKLLSRLSGSQLHVQFITQKLGSKSAKKGAKLVDTLEILIADTRGTRAYETYSGGEAFRINFAIRLALAKLLAQRAGAALQLLIIDEGFGTQDTEGCDRLIASINAIASDFACILTVTHIPHLKEAFQARIEVNKNQQGSHLSLSI
ncbi:exonuclease subunit SbcC [Cylindrospermopsis curvispora]|uniref:Nuclease SbcCD subunit C n=1 Tax=Cylindrospermopsis curvispora GIHE-G1 TaxID=2666332 RepID=A0A7H0EWB2_9CYAN|nr:exonuclease subunit SbcC [Cylindrospermopsis curvispora]QNP28078.1 exonuclease subunit SbcC [Cylindrospermopsis curvispora GIHE-G1]